jgi:hypothetical protein
MEAAMGDEKAEVESRQLHLARGHSSLYGFCIQELKMSEGAAYRRISEARDD